MPFFTGRKKKDKMDITKHEQMKELGILVATSGELEERLIDREQFKAALASFTSEEPLDKETKAPLSPAKQIELMASGLNDVDTLLKKVAVPFGRGGTEQWYGEALLGWEKLLAMARNYCSVARSMLERREEEYIDRRDLVRKLRSFIVVEILRYAQWIEDVSYYTDDVSKRTVITIQQPVLPGFGSAGAPAPRPGSMQFPPGPTKREED